MWSCSLQYNPVIYGIIIRIEVELTDILQRHCERQFVAASLNVAHIAISQPVIVVQKLGFKQNCIMG